MGRLYCGLLLDATHVVATDWGNLVGTFSPDDTQIDWANGTVWNI
jgi:hypothetical protein